MRPDLSSAMLLGYTRSGRPVWQIAGAEGEGGSGGSGGGAGAGDKDQIDPEAAKAAIAVVAKMKDAGVEDPSSALELIGKLRAFEKGDKLPAAVKKQLDELQTKVKEFETGKLTNEEKTAKQIADLETQLAKATEQAQSKTTRVAFLASATKAKALYPDDVVKLVDLASVEFDEEGNPTNADALVEALKKDRPALFQKPGNFDGGVRQSDGKVDMNALLRQSAGRT